MRESCCPHVLRLAIDAGEFEIPEFFNNRPLHGPARAGRPRHAAPARQAQQGQL